MFRHFFSTIVVVFSGLVFLLLVVTRFSFEVQLVFSIVALMVAYLLRRRDADIARMALVFMTIVISTRYIYWRYTDTLQFSDPGSLVVGYALFGAELYAFVVLLLGYVQTAAPLNRKPCALPNDTSLWPTVDLYIPTYNEPLHVVKSTILAAQNIDWPKNKLKIYVLDDGDRTEFRQFSELAGVNYISRTDNLNAKAGNINNAMGFTNGELIAIFDCDHVPTRSFLQLTVGWFLKDKKLGALQTPHHYYTPDPFEKNLDIHGTIPNEGKLFYGLVQDGNDFWDASFFCGTCAVLRRSSLEEIGGVSVETVTEDALTALRLHRAGYTSAYINVAQAAGMATETLSDHINQRIRWARGLAQIFRIDNPLFARGLSFAQRLCYTNATIHFLYAIPRLIFLTAPLCYLFFDLYIIHTEAIMIAVMAIPHILHNHISTAKLHRPYRHSFWAEVYETVLSVYILPVTLAALIIPKQSVFKVTAKGNVQNSSYFAYRVAMPFVVLAVLNIAGLSVGLLKLFYWGSADADTVVLNIVWTLYNLIIIGVTIAVAWEVKQSRVRFRHKVGDKASIRTSQGYLLDATVLDLSETGALLRLSGEPESPSDYADDLMLYLASPITDVALQSEIVALEGKNLRIRFSELTIDKQRELVRYLYSPADAWVEDYRSSITARSHHSLFRLVKFSLYGFARLLSGTFIRANRQDTEQNMLPTFVVMFAVLMAVAVFFSHPVNAQEVESDTVYNIAVLTERYDKEIEIGEIRYGLTVPFSIRRDAIVEQAKLSLVLSYGGARADSQDYLKVELNGETLWVADDVRNQKQLLEFDIDPATLSEFNTIRLSLDRSSQQNCLADEHAGFKVLIHQESRLAMQTRRLPFADNLANLPLPFFDDRDPRPASINVVLSTAAQSKTLEAAATISGWLGTLAKYRGVLFNVSKGDIPQNNAILVGPVDDLPDSVDISNIEGPTIRIQRNPADTDYDLLIVTGRNEKEVRTASLSLIRDDIKLSGSSVTVEGVPSARIKQYTAPNWVATDQPVKLSEIAALNGSLLHIEENDFSPIQLDFTLPADLYRMDRSDYELNLDYFFEPLLEGIDERLFVSLNGEQVAVVKVDDKQDYRFWHKLPVLDSLLATDKPESAAKIRLPAKLLHASNQLEFRFTTPSSIDASCIENGVDNKTLRQVKAGITPSSWFNLESNEHFSKLPNLALFSNSGLPFTRNADLSRTAVILSDNASEAELSLYLTVMARFASITGLAPFNVSVIDSSLLEEYSDYDYLVFGDVSNSPVLESWLERSPFSSFMEGLRVRNLTLQERVFAIFNLRNPFAELQTLRSDYERLSQDASVMFGLESPLHRGRSVLFFHAQDPNTYYGLSQSIVDPSRYKLLQGATALVTLDTITSYPGNNTYLAGNLTWLSQARVSLASNPWTPLLSLLVIAFVFSYFFMNRVEKRKQKRLNSDD